MPLASNNVDIGTAISATGGTATSFLGKGSSLDKRFLSLDDGSVLKDETTYSFGIKRPKVSAGAPGGYTQARNTLFIQMPKTLANGEVTKNSLRVELSADPETTDSEKVDILAQAAQMMFETAFRPYWTNQDIS
jgi:hypothetical protein